MQSYLANRTQISSRNPVALDLGRGSNDFQPLLETVTAAPAVERLRFEEPPALEEPARPAHKLEAPQIELVQEEGRVVRIIVTCRCCEQIEIDCAY